jgi:hypothetical protein
MSDFRNKNCGVFLAPRAEKRPKTRLKKIEGEKKNSQLFWQKGFDMDFLQKVFGGVFELPVLRNAQKRH